MKAHYAKLILDCIYIIRKEKVWKYMKEIDKYQWLNPDSLKELQWRKLKKVLNFAYNNIPYYRKTWQNLGIHPNDIKTIDDFRKLPILTKEILKNNYNLLKPKNKKTRVSIRQTSGSTGIPLKLEKNRQTTAYMDAVMYRSYMWYGIRPGDRQLRIWGAEIDPILKFKMHLKDFLLNRIRLSAFELDRKNFLKFIRKIKTFKPVFVYGYAQSVFEFAKFIVDEKIDIRHLKFKAVIVTGEMIFGWQKEVIKKAFSCPVVNEYGCTEVGIIAIECAMGGMHIMSDALFVEFIKNDTASNLKEREIVVTELNNFYSPLIRYKVGDKGILSNSLCPCGRGFPLMASIKGRSDEFIVFPNGKKVDPYVFEYIIKNIPSKYGTINQFLIIQESISCLNLKLVCDTSCPQKLVKALNNSWVKLYGNDLSLKVEFVNNISKNASGKLVCFESFLNK